MVKMHLNLRDHQQIYIYRYIYIDIDIDKDIDIDIDICVVIYEPHVNHKPKTSNEYIHKKGTRIQI